MFRTWLGKLREKNPVNAELMSKRYVEWRGVAELAAAMGLDADAVSSRLKRLKKKFQAWLARYWDDEPAPR